MKRLAVSIDLLKMIRVFSLGDISETMRK